MKSKKPSLYDAQEEQIQLQSASFVDFLTRKGVLEDHNIDNERVRKGVPIVLIGGMTPQIKPCIRFIENSLSVCQPLRNVPRQA